MNDYQLRGARGQLRQSALVRGRGWPQLIKLPSPAAGANLTHTVPGEYWERFLALAFTLTTSAAAGFRSVNVNYLDGDSNIWNQVQITGTVGPSTAQAFYGDLAQPTTLIDPVTQSATGSVTDPGAGATIASIVLPQGSWVLQVTEMLPAGGAAADQDNMGIYQGANLIATPALDPFITAPQVDSARTVNIPAGGATIAVKAIAAASGAGIVYVAEINATPGLQSNGFQMPDFILKAAYGIQVAVGNIQAADTITGAFAYTERYPSSDTDELGMDPVAELIALIQAAGP